MWLPNYSVHEIFGDAGFRPGGRGPFLSGKGPKTIDAQFGLIGWDGRRMGSGPTRCAQTRSAEYIERPTRGPNSRRRILGRMDGVDGGYDPW